MKTFSLQAKVTALWMVGLVVVNGFSSVAKFERRSLASPSAVNQIPDDLDSHRDDMVKFFTCLTAAFLIMTSQPFPATASSVNHIESMPTIQVAETIKELDFSLPKYDDIKSYKASAENVESLTIKTTPIKPGSLGLSTASSSGVLPGSTFDDDSNPVNSVMSSLLPSLSKKGPASP